MTGKDAFKIWALAAGIWSDWVRPVPFVFADLNQAGNTDFMPLFPDLNLVCNNYSNSANNCDANSLHNYSNSVGNVNSNSANDYDINANADFYSLSSGDLRSAYNKYIKKFGFTFAVILDLPSAEAIFEGMTLACMGFLPVPVYNGCDAQAGTMSIVSNRDTELALVAAAEKLKGLSLLNDAPPAFLLDSNRTQRFKMDVSVFDNSWDIYPQDLPAGEYFLKNGITKIIVRGQKLNKDLKTVLYKHQRLGIKIYFDNSYKKSNCGLPADDEKQLKEVKIKKPRK